jgi:hydroxypyruvate isomerase
VPGCLVPTPAAAVSLIEEVGSDAVALLYDAYHAAAAGFDPATQAVELLDWIRHVQYADHPGRSAPGTGSLRLAELAEALDGAGYRGAIGLEFAPCGPTPSRAEIEALCERPAVSARVARARP